MVLIALQEVGACGEVFATISNLGIRDEVLAC